MPIFCVSALLVDIVLLTPLAAFGLLPFPGRGEPLGARSRSGSCPRLPLRLGRPALLLALPPLRVEDSRRVGVLLLRALGLRCPFFRLLVGGRMQIGGDCLLETSTSFSDLPVNSSRLFSKIGREEGVVPC